MVETLLLSMLFEGRLHSLEAKTLLSKSNITVIRPLIFVEEKDIKGFRNKYQLPVIKNPCPVDGRTKRQYAKELIKQLNKDHLGAKDRIFTAIKDSLL